MKNWIKGANSVVLSLAAVGIFILLTIFLGSLRGMQWDLTANKKFTLSDMTTTTLANLEQPIHAIAFTEPGEVVVSRSIKDMLDEYGKLSSNFTWEEVDPRQSPTLAQQYGITSYGTIVFISGEMTKNVTTAELFAYGSQQTSYTFSGEARFTQAILDLSSGERHIAYAITGHNQLTLSSASAFRTALGNEGIDLRELNLFMEGAIPEDAETLVVLSPMQDLSDAEADIILDFLEGGGKLYMTMGLAPEMETWVNWGRVLHAVGVQSQNALVIETAETLSSDPFTIVPQHSYHDIVNKLTDERMIVAMPAVISLEAVQDLEEYRTYAFLRTSFSGYGKTDLEMFTGAAVSLTQEMIEKQEGDLEGPLNLAFAVTRQEDSSPKAVVIGNGLFLRDDWIYEQGNRDLALNSIGWLNEQRETVTIRPREDFFPDQVYIALDKQKLIFWGTVAAFPLAFLLLGGIVWWRRRRG